MSSSKTKPFVTGMTPSIPFKKSKTPTKLPHVTANSRPSAKSQSPNGKGVSAFATIDIATGNKLVNVYLDPNDLLDNDNTYDDWFDYHLYEPANVIKEDNGVLTIRVNDGKIFKMLSSHATYVREQDNEGVDDILNLREVTEMSLIHTLRVRYERDDIYTFVGTILISINPYKWFKDLYSDETMHEYHNNTKKHAPHMFVIAENAYSNLMQSRIEPFAHDQSIIISGESGSGKVRS